MYTIWLRLRREFYTNKNKREQQQEQQTSPPPSTIQTRCGIVGNLVDPGSTAEATRFSRDYQLRNPANNQPSDLKPFQFKKDSNFSSVNDPGFITIEMSRGGWVKMAMIQLNRSIPRSGDGSDSSERFEPDTRSSNWNANDNEGWGFGVEEFETRWGHLPTGVPDRWPTISQRWSAAQN